MSAGPTETTVTTETSPVPSYIADGPEIYRRSFAIIRAEADLAHLPEDAHDVVVRMIHSCGMVDLATDTEVSPGAVTAAQAALRGGAPVLCDAAMVASGITRRFLPADNEVLCTLHDPRVPDLAARQRTTRSAAALELWREHLDGAVVAIGNAPTALFRLLEMISDGAPRPAVVLGLPVGFVGAMESKAALVGHPAGVEHIVVHGRRGGSAMAVGAVNALALGCAGDAAQRSSTPGAGDAAQRSSTPGAGDAAQRSSTPGAGR